METMQSELKLAHDQMSTMWEELGRQQVSNPLVSIWIINSLKEWAMLTRAIDTTYAQYIIQTYTCNAPIKVFPLRPPCGQTRGQTRGLD